MNRFYRLTITLSFLVLIACSNEDPPSTAPANVTINEGESLIAVNWDVLQGRTYWIFYNRGTSVSLDVKDAIVYNITPPYLITGLANDTQYAVSVTSSQSGSEVGPFSPVQTATPRLLSPAVPWFEGVSLSTNALRSIAFANNTYVTTGNAATLFIGAFSYTSDSGVTSWEAPTSLPVTASTNLAAVIFDGARFMALGEDGSISKNSSTDILVWEAATPISTPPTMNALTVGAGIYLAVGDSGAIYTNGSDGATDSWTLQTSGSTNNLYGAAFVNNRFIVVGDNGTLLTSDDGITWNTETSNTANTLRHVAYGASTFVAVGDAGTIVSSADATIWTAQTIPTPESFRSIVFGPDQQFIAVGTTGTLAYSTTGADGSWAVSNAGSIELNSIAPGQVFIAVGAAGTNVSGK